MSGSGLTFFLGASFWWAWLFLHVLDSMLTVVHKNIDVPSIFLALMLMKTRKYYFVTSYIL